jgi:hypothetical protein
MKQLSFRTFVLILFVFSYSQTVTGQDEGNLDPVNQIGVSSGSGVIASGLDFSAAFFLWFILIFVSG